MTHAALHKRRRPTQVALPHRPAALLDPIMPACRLFPDLPPGGGAVLVQFLRFMILINQLIPISLYVTLELVKVAQCTLLTWDLHMYHKATGTPFLCRTTTLNEELGQVQYVLSDKTGQCSVGAVLLEQAISETLAHVT